MNDGDILASKLSEMTVKFNAALNTREYDKVLIEASILRQEMYDQSSALFHYVPKVGGGFSHVTPDEAADAILHTWAIGLGKFVEGLENIKSQLDALKLSLGELDGYQVKSLDTLEDEGSLKAFQTDFSTMLDQLTAEHKKLASRIKRDASRGNTPKRSSQKGDETCNTFVIKSQGPWSVFTDLCPPTAATLVKIREAIETSSSPTHEDVALVAEGGAFIESIKEALTVHRLMKILQVRTTQASENTPFINQVERAKQSIKSAETLLQRVELADFGLLAKPTTFDKHKVSILRLSLMGEHAWAVVHHRLNRMIHSLDEGAHSPSIDAIIKQWRDKTIKCKKPNFIKNVANDIGLSNLLQMVLNKTTHAHCIVHSRKPSSTMPRPILSFDQSITLIRSNLERYKQAHPEAGQTHLEDYRAVEQFIDMLDLCGIKHRLEMMRDDFESQRSAEGMDPHFLGRFNATAMQALGFTKENYVIMCELITTEIENFFLKGASLSFNLEDEIKALDPALFESIVREDERCTLWWRDQSWKHIFHTWLVFLQGFHTCDHPNNDVPYVTYHGDTKGMNEPSHWRGAGIYCLLQCLSSVQYQDHPITIVSSVPKHADKPSRQLMKTAREFAEYYFNHNRSQPKPLKIAEFIDHISNMIGQLVKPSPFPSIDSTAVGVPKKITPAQVNGFFKEMTPDQEEALTALLQASAYRAQTQ